MRTVPKLPAQPARKGSTTAQSPKLPDRQFDPRRTVERKGQWIMKRWEPSPKNTQTRQVPTTAARAARHDNGRTDA